MKKKVVFWGPYIGWVGTIQAQYNGAKALAKLPDYECELVRAHSEWEHLKDKKLPPGVSIVDFGLSRLFPGIETGNKLSGRLYMYVVALFSFPLLIRYFWKEKPTLLVTSLLSLPAILACKIGSRKTRILASIQGFPQFLSTDSEAADYPLWKRMENKVRRLLWRLIYPLADIISPLTNRTKTKLVEAFPKQAHKLVVISNPVVDSDVAQASQHDVATTLEEFLTNRASEKLALVAVGRLSKQKGFDVLLHAFSSVLSDYDAELFILGEGEDRQNLEKLIQALDLEGVVHLCGFAENPYSVLSKADLFVSSSRWEDPGHAIIEAAFLRVPIVTTDCPNGPAELVLQGKGGHICNVDDIEGMAQAIRDALSEDSSSKVTAAYDKSLEFSGHHYAAQVDHLFGGLSVNG